MGSGVGSTVGSALGIRTMGIGGYILVGDLRGERDARGPSKRLLAFGMRERDEEKVGNSPLRLALSSGKDPKWGPTVDKDVGWWVIGTSMLCLRIKERGGETILCEIRTSAPEERLDTEVWLRE